MLKTSIIQPINAEQQKKVVEKTHEYFEKSARLFNIKVTPITILFNLSGRCAGMYRISAHYREIRYNPYIFAKFFDENIKTTVPHEVAHYITDLLFGIKHIKPHGKEWKNIMAKFNADNSVRASFDLSGITTKTYQQFPYVCACQTHQLSKIRHHRMAQKKYRYFCKFCKQTLIYNPA